MSEKERKVSFFHLSQKNNSDGKTETLSEHEVERNFESIYDSMSVLNDNRRAILITINGMQVVVEIIKYSKDEHYAFIKLGYQNSSNTTALRDQSSLQTESIHFDEKKNQRVEIYTCCYIDFTSCIVSYIGVMSAPRISALRMLFDLTLKDQEISSTFSSILCPNVLNNIMSNRRCAKIEIAVAIPADSILSEDFGPNKFVFDGIARNNIKSCKQTFSLSATRMKSMFDSVEGINKAFDAIRGYFGDNLSKVLLTMKSDGEGPLVIDLMQESMTYKATIEIDDAHALDDMDNSLSILVECYKSNKEELSQYIRTG